MSRWARRRGFGPVATALVLAAAATALSAGVAGAALSGGVAGAAPAGPPPPGGGKVRAVGAAGQRAARAYWTRSRMEAATPAGAPVKGGPSAAAPRGIPSPTRFNGVPTVGALFYTMGAAKHFCTASVVRSSTADLIITAAHCVYTGSYAGNIEFVPAYYAGRKPYGAWAVTTVIVAARWARSRNPNLDVAFLSVTPPAGAGAPIQQVTGALRLGIKRPYRRPIEAVGYNDRERRPIGCATHSFEFRPGQMEFYCHDYRAGTSGGPLIVRYHRRTGSGVVIGVIGGYEQGGDVDWASYSPYFGRAVLELFRQAEGK